MLRTALMGAAIGCGTAFFSAFGFKKLAFILGIIDDPGPRKIHNRTVPLLGGAAVCAGTWLAMLAYPAAINDNYLILIGATIVFLINIFDDARGLSAKIRFSAEMITAFWVIISGVKISFFPPSPIGDICEIIISLIWFVGMTNAFNYLDGMDGLAAGSAIINCVFFGALLMLGQQDSLGFVCLALAGAALGFLPHNFKKATMFLGDAGSTFIGFLLAGIGIAGDWAGSNIVKIVIPVIVLGVPIFDMIFTTITRVTTGKVRSIIGWFIYAGRDHFHHYIVDIGLLPIGAVFFIWAITASLGLSAVRLSYDTKWWEAAIALAQAIIIFTIIGVVIVVGRRERRSGWWRLRQQRKCKKR